MSRVSVIIPAYNREKFIERSIESVLSQTYQDFEIIVVDDGSTDNTKKVLERYDGKIKYFYQENGGSSAARNRGIQESTGEYIAFLDSDDIWMPDKLAIQVEILDKNTNIGIVHSKMMMFNEKGDEIGVKPEKPTGRNFMELIEIAGDLPTSSVITRRECFNKAGMFDTNLMTIQDFDMWLRISQHYGIYEYKEKSLAHYFRHGQQNTSKRSNLLKGLVLFNRKVLKNYGNLPNFPISIYRKRIASHEYWLSKEYYNEKHFSNSIKYLATALLRYPLIGPLFFEKNDGILKKIIICIKPYGYLVVCFLQLIVSCFKFKSTHSTEQIQKSLKILFVHENHDNIAGQELSLLNRLQGLQKIGVHCAVLLSEEGIFSECLKKNGFEVKYSPLNRLSVKNLLSFLKTISGIRRILIEGHFSLIHCSGAYPTQYSLPAARLCGRPCIVHINTTVYDRKNLSINFVRHADYIFTVSDAVRKKVSETIRIQSNKIMTIYCGVKDGGKHDYSTERSALRKQFNILPRQKVIGQISSIIPRKGLEDFINMARIIKDDYPDVKFMIVGRDEDIEYRDNLIELIAKLNLEDDIIFTGFQEDIYKFIDLIDVHVLASEAEGLARVIVHAQMGGKPVVATDVSGNSEAIVHQKTGLLVPQGDPNILAESVLKLLRDSEKTKKISEAAKENALKQFQIERHAKILKDVYLRILK